MEKDGLAKSSDTSIEKEGFISKNLSKDGIPNQSLANDHIGIENISVEPSNLYVLGSREGRSFADVIDKPVREDDSERVIVKPEFVLS